ncbi:MAG TPA: hypothetical protein VFW71_01890 [Actinomycetota bacterium]|nr:hypothetical protein [Actinomycetota bacterium]
MPDTPDLAPALGPDLEAALDALYAAPQDGFIAARDALVKDLRAGDATAKAAAVQVKGLRKPSVTAWALNRVARSNREDVAALFDADQALARAQREGSGPEALGQATRKRREVVKRLLDAALAALREGGHPDSPGARDRIAQTLTAVATDDAGREAFRRGRLASDLEPASLWEASPSGGPSGRPAHEDGEARRAPESPLRRQAADLQARADVLAQAAADAEKGAAAAELQSQEAAAEAARLRQVADRAMDVAVAARARAEEAAVRAREAAEAASGET